MTKDKVSVIITVLNGSKWVDNCCQSISAQTILKKSLVDSLEISVFDDASSDNTFQLLQNWKSVFNVMHIKFIIQRNSSGKPKGVGYGRNRAIEASTGNYLCFQDIDDEMLPERMEKQYLLGCANKDSLIGGKFKRSPPDSTCRFTSWANDLTEEQLTVQIYSSNGPTIIMPTWFCHRSVYEKVAGGFCEQGPGTPEDLIFFYKHIDREGSILRVNECLLYYRYHLNATTFSVAAETIWRIRFEHLLKNVLVFQPWSEGFTIWNAGKQGRHFFRRLPDSMKQKVFAFCDVDKKKINKVYQFYENRQVTHKVPIVHFTAAQKPLLICMKLNLTKGLGGFESFETNLKSLNLDEGKDFILFT